MRRILVVYFSQTGQLRDIVASIAAPLVAQGELDVVTAQIKPRQPYPFPWPFWQFFSTFPETVAELPDPIEPLDIGSNPEFDLVILAYQVWFLSPSMPMMAFLQSEQAKQLLRNRRVVTVIGCRNMWMQAQERMKLHLQRLSARLVDNVVFTDSTHMAATFISTPLWMLTGRRGPFLGGLVPVAGITQKEIAAASRFGHAVAVQLNERAEHDDSPFFAGLGAVKVTDHLIASEAVGRRSFRIWGVLLRACGRPTSLSRRAVLGVYIVFLICLILTVAPLSALVRSLLRPLTKKRAAAQRRYFAAPSGESDHLRERIASGS
jgi:hypothetical protein